MTTWFTADQHFGHANIIKWCKRPFNDINEMEQVIIDNYNEVVAADDHVFMLGDLSWLKKRKQPL